MAIKNVVIAGATGNAGSAIIKAIADSGRFDVTALTRTGGSKTDPISNVGTIAVDYANPQSLVDALQGQDAVICALNPACTTQQRALLDAAVRAGVQRFIPAEFGSDTLNVQAAKLPLFANKKAAQQYLEELVAQDKISYTLVLTGPFMDFGLAMGFLGPDLKKKQVTYIDGGNARYSTSTLAAAGQAVVGVLTKPDETKNRAVYVQSTALTMREFFALAQRAVGVEGWTEIEGGKTEDIEQASRESLARGQKNMMVMLGFLMSAMWRDGYGGHFHQLDNELLGVKQLTDDEIVAMIKDIASRKSV